MKFTKHDSAESLNTPEDIAYFVEAVAEDYDPFFVAHALGSLARALGVHAMAEHTGLSRDAIFEALNGDGVRGEATLKLLLQAYGRERLAPAAE